MSGADKTHTDAESYGRRRGGTGLCSEPRRESKGSRCEWDGKSPTNAPGGDTIVEPTTGPEAPVSAQEQEAIDIMWRMIARYGTLDEGAAISAGRNSHPGLIPVLVESARLTLNPSVALKIARVLEQITGVSAG